MHIKMTKEIITFMSIIISFALIFIGSIIIQVEAQAELSSMTTDELEQLIGIKETFGALSEDDGPEMCKILVNRTDASAGSLISCVDVLNLTTPNK